MTNEEKKHDQSQNQGKQQKGMLLGTSGRGYAVRKIFVKNGHVYGVTDTEIIEIR